MTARTSMVNLTCPHCGTPIRAKVPNPSKPIALAVYSGVPGGRGRSDGELLLNLAAWLDKIDDAADGEFRAAHKGHRSDREIQRDLRRIATAGFPA